jgi:hypothetical protein
MKRAHELTVKRWNAKLLNGIQPAPYKVLFAIALKDAHKEFKAMQLTKEQEKLLAIKHFESAIASTLEHFEKLGVNDYYVAVENNAQLNDYTILAHKVEGDTSSALGWSNYAGALVVSGKQADMYVVAYQGVVKLHAQTYLSKVLDNFRELLEKVKN